MRITITTLALLLAFVLGARAQEPEYISFYDGATTHYVGYNPSGYDIVTLGDYNGRDVSNFTIHKRILFKDGSWNTLCLPFNYAVDGDVLNGAEAHTLSSSSFDNGTLTLNFSARVSTLLAGVPYIIKWGESGDIENPVFAMYSTVTLNTTLSPVTTDYVDFVGSYSPVPLDANDRTKLYLGSANTLYYPSSAMTIGPCRAHFVLKGITAGDKPTEVRAFTLRFIEDPLTEGSNFGDEFTGIVSVTTDSKDFKASGWFTLDGRRLSDKPTQRGVYINGGKQVVVN
jgi:hypothetical protein